MADIKKTGASDATTDAGAAITDPGAAVTNTGDAVTDIAPQRAELASVRAKLAAIYASFDPAHLEPLLAREAEIVELANRAEQLREIVERWDEAKAKRANILAAWELVKAFTGARA